MADELNTPTHRWYQRRYNIALSPNEVSPKWILAAGIAKINAWIASLAGYAVNGFDPALVFDFKGNYFRKSATASTFGASITHAATTNATMVDSDGLLKWRPHNNITKSNTFSTWSKNSTIVDNAAVGPNGIANTASTVNFPSTTSYLYNLSTVAVSAGDKVTLAAWVRSDTITSLTFATNGRTNPANNASDANLAVTPTWTLVSFESTVAGNDTGLFFMIGKYNPASPASQIGDLELYGAHIFRSDLGGMANNPDTNSSYVPTTNTNVYAPRRGHHVYNGSAWVNEGILHESEARTNVFTYSSDLSNVVWGMVTSTTTANAGVSPSGLTDALRWEGTGSSTFYQSTAYIDTATYTVSCWVKSNGASKDTFRLFGRDSYISADFTATSDWVRYSFTFTTTQIASASRQAGVARDTAGADTDLLLYGFQIELGSTPSSYIPTTSGATVTRAAETLTVPAANLPYDSTNMSIQMDGKMTYADTGISSEVEMYRWILNGTNYINSTVQAYSSKTGEPVFSQRESATALDSVVGSGNTYAPDTNVPFNIAVRHGSTFINAANEGTLLTANTTPTALPNLSSTNLTLGFDFLGTIGQLRMWDEDITDAGLVEAST